MQLHHFAIAYLCLYPYTNKLFMRKSRVPAIESCACISSAELIGGLYEDLQSSQFLPLASQIHDTTKVTRK